MRVGRAFFRSQRVHVHPVYTPRASPARAFSARRLHARVTPHACSECGTGEGGQGTGVGVELSAAEAAAATTEVVEPLAEVVPGLEAAGAVEGEEEEEEEEELTPRAPGS